MPIITQSSPLIIFNLKQYNKDETRFHRWSSCRLLCAHLIQKFNRLILIDRDIILVRHCISHSSTQTIETIINFESIESYLHLNNVCKYHSSHKRERTILEYLMIQMTNKNEVSVIDRLCTVCLCENVHINVYFLSFFVYFYSKNV